MNLVNRIIAPTPVFFQKLRDIGLVLVTIGGVALSTPMNLPVHIVSLANYASLVGGVLAAIAQLTVNEEPQEHD
jgi:hypothetical protein